MSTFPVLDSALDAFRRGFAPIPISPGKKRPTGSNWAELDFADDQQLRTRFLAEQDVHGGVGVGIRVGQPSGGLIDIDLDHSAAVRLSRIILPNTAAKHGRPSRALTHWWYVATDELPSYRKFTLPDGETLMELRSTGQQTVIPPSMHPDGEPYEWHGEPWGGPSGPERIGGLELHVRVLTLALTATLLHSWPVQGGRHDAYLALAGGMLRYGGVDGETGAVHPLWEQQLPNLIRILADATGDEDGPDTRVHEVFDTTMKALRSGKKVQGFPTLGKIIGGPASDRVLEYAKDIENLLDFPARGGLRPADDVPLTGVPEDADTRSERLRRREAAQSAPLQDRDPLAERVDTWEAVDLRPYLSSDAVGPTPGILRRTDGIGLMYPGRVNSLYGSSESGKTWLALWAAKAVLADGGRVMIVDCEDGPTILVDRLRSLGFAEDDVADRLAYINPDTPLGSLMVDRYGHPAPSDTGINNEKALLAVLDLMQPDLIVVDGLTALYGMHALNPNDAAATDKITSWMRKLTQNDARTVLMVDHTSKNSQPGSTPTGSQHKVAMVQGTALHVMAITKPRKAHTGLVQIFVGKDRPGAVRQHLTSDEDDLIAEVTMDSDQDGTFRRFEINPPDPSKLTVDGSSLPDGKRSAKSHLDADRASVLKGLRAGTGPMRRGEIELAMRPARITEARMKAALRSLVDDGTVRAAGTRPQTRYEIVPED